MGIPDGNGETLVSPEVQGEEAERADLILSVQRWAGHCEREKIPVQGVDHMDVFTRTVGILPTVELRVFQARFHKAVSEYSKRRLAVILRRVCTGTAATILATVTAAILVSSPNCSGGDSKDAHGVNQGQAVEDTTP